MASNNTSRHHNHDNYNATTTPAFASERLSDTAGVVREVAKKIGRARIRWDNVNSIMIITKPGDVSLITKTRELALWLLRLEQLVGLTVFVDEKLKHSRRFRYLKIKELNPEIKLKFWNPELCASNPKSFDFIVTLGGDGTVLFTSWLFQSYVPPIVPFSLGSLGFLTPFEFENHKQHLKTIIEKGVRINLRSRLTCTVYRRIHNDRTRGPQLRNVKWNPVTGKMMLGDMCGDKISDRRKKFGEVDGEDVEEDGLGSSKSNSNGHAYEAEAEEERTATMMLEERQIPCFTTIPVERYHVINDLVVDRGPSPFVSMLELFGDDQHLTTVQADGLAISTPTGSTAYSLSAGGSLTHPEIHAILITPICPHTLSFRPTLVPDSMELRVCVPYNSRNTAWASFDGRGRVELRQGDHIKITASRHPFPTVCREDQTTDWFNSLSNSLHWNIRQRQKSFAVVEAPRQRVGTRLPPAKTRSSSPTSPTNTNKPLDSSNVSSTTSEEVFGLLWDDDDKGGRSSNEQGQAGSLNRSSDNLMDIDESEEDDDDELPVFNGWTDDEIIMARLGASTKILDASPGVERKIHMI